MATKKISELDAITSIDSNDLFVVVDSSEGETNKITKENALSGLQPTISTINKLSSDLVDDTEATNKFVTSSDITNWNSKVSTSDMQTALNTKQDILTAGTGIDITNNVISNTQTSAEWGNITGTLADQTDLKNALDSKANSSDLSTVATSGSYSDLSNKPTIPDELADLSDDSTHRLVTDTEKTTWGGKQDALVSGTNIKTINNESILGSGNITIQGGGSSTPTIVYSTSSSTDVGTSSTKALDLDSLSAGNYIYSNYSSAYKFYYKYTRPGETSPLTSNITNGNMYNYLIGTTTAYYYTIYVEMYHPTSDLSTMALNEMIGKVTLDCTNVSNYVGYTSVDYSQKTSWYLYKSSNQGGVGYKRCHAFTDSSSVDYLLNNKLQKKLVSGSNIKTINNNSLLGSGNISLEATPEISIGTTTPSGDEVLWINPEDTPSGSLNPITNTYSEATDKGYSCNYLNSSVVETGTNTNGTYIKYGNGVMICTKVVETSIAFNTEWGSGWYEGSQSIGNYAQEFISTPQVFFTNNSTSGAILECFETLPTKTNGGTILYCCVGSSTRTIKTNVMAIGMWK